MDDAILSDDTAWTDVLGDSDRIRVLEACIDHQRRSFDSGVIADTTPLSEDEIEPHLDDLWEIGVITKSVEDTSHKYEINSINSTAMALKTLNVALVGESSVQSEFDKGIREGDDLED